MRGVTKLAQRLPSSKLPAQNAKKLSNADAAQRTKCHLKRSKKPFARVIVLVNTGRD
jgi:hypothetical protein